MFNIHSLDDYLLLYGDDPDQPGQKQADPDSGSDDKAAQLA